MKDRKLLFLLFTFVAAVTLGAQTRPDALKEYRAGNYNRAVEICRMELQESPGNMDSYTVLGWSRLRAGKYQEALEAGLRG